MNDKKDDEKPNLVLGIFALIGISWLMGLTLISLAKEIVKGMGLY